MRKQSRRLTVHVVGCHEEVLRAEVKRMLLSLGAGRRRQLAERVVLQIVEEAVAGRLQRSRLGLIFLSVATDERFDLALVALEVNLAWKFRGGNLDVKKV